MIGIVAVSKCSKSVGRCSLLQPLAQHFGHCPGVLDQYQIDRLLTFTDPDRDLQGIGYNTAQARIAIGGGGLLGQGSSTGIRRRGAFVPYQQTDFVFSVAGEELGLIGASILIALVGVILWRGIQIARLARDPFGRPWPPELSPGSHSRRSGKHRMNLGIMPVTGVPLPFVSYGGTSMFAAWIGIGCFSPCTFVRGRSMPRHVLVSVRLSDALTGSSVFHELSDSPAGQQACPVRWR